MKILLVDDEEKFVMMLAKRLRMRKIEADYVSTGQQALEKIKHQRYDIAVLDVKMPKIGGIELKHKLNERVPDLKIIFLTGHASKADYDAAAQEDTLFLSKPVKIENLVKILHQLKNQ
ncbi:MAG: response regulator [Desulfobacteraceae bacterium]|nr:response regulator [Desulfobacteraceae bacterium]